MQTLTDKVVLVTGASRGIGVDIARAFARERCRLALAARSVDELDAVGKEVEAVGAQAVAIPADVGDLESCRALVRETEERLGPVDVLVNNAGIERPYDFENYEPEFIEQVIRVNLIGAAWLTNLVAPSMVARRAGHVVFVASVAGLVPVPHNSPYSASKHGMVGLARALRLELADHGIGVSVVCPGFVDGGMFLEWGRKPPGGQKAVTAEEVARACVRAVREDRGEVTVTHGLAKIGDVVAAIAPETGGKIMARMGVLDYLREQARINAERWPRGA